MRTLASIQKIIDIQPIPNADAIEVATVLGWHVVVKKGEFHVGDQCVYFEIDSLLPLREEFSFLEKGGGIKKMLIDGREIRGYRLKTVRLRGQISQGLIFPTSILPQSLYPVQIANLEGMDVTQYLGVYKYEPPLPAELGGKAIGLFPGFIPKTDETRIQSVPQLLERYKDTEFYVTEKIDGTSMTVFISPKDNELHVCSRGIDWADDGNNSMWKVAHELKLKEILEKYKGKYALQGEFAGENIQKNVLKIKGHKFFIFNVFDMESHRYVGFNEFISFCASNKLETVPIIETTYHLPQEVDEIVAFATQKSEYNSDSMLEGLVFRPFLEINDISLGRLSFKVINPEYLLKYD